MSNLFDVLKKDNAIDLADICEVQTDQPEPVAEKIASVPPLPLIVPRLKHARRVQRLKVSALAPLFPFDDAHYAAAEQYRLIRTKILHGGRKPHLLVISSPCSGDGKTVTSINIAASLALGRESSVLLVDADLRRPRIAKELGIPSAPGLADVISGTASFEDAVVQAEQFPSLCVLAAGDVKANPAELIDSDRCRRLIEQMQSKFDLVVFDTTPAETVADYELLQKICDAMVVVVRPGRTNRRACAKVLETVPKEKLLGIVLNGVEDWLFWQTPAYGYYSKLPAQQSGSE